MATDSRREVVGRLEPVIKKVRDRRRYVEDRWLSSHAAWFSRRTQVHYQSDHFQHYIPIARRAIEQTVTRMRQMLVPDNDFFEVYPGDEFDMGNSIAADAVSTFMLHLMEQRIGIKSVATQLCRSMALYGRAVTNTCVEVVHWQESAGSRAVKHVDIWPTMRAVDVFNFYHYPETTNDLDRCQLIFEDSMYPWADYLDEVEGYGGLVESISRKDLTKPIWPDHHLQRLSYTSLSTPSDVSSASRESSEQPQVGDFVQITGGFMKSGQTWMHFWIAWNLKTGPRVVRLHKMVGERQPYRLGVHRELPGESYTSGQMDDIRSLQILFNDQINRMEEASSLAAVPPVRINPLTVTRTDSLVFRPRAKWIMEPDGAKLLEIPDTSRGSQAAANMTMNMITSVFSPGGITQGQPPRGSPRAGFAFSSMVNLGMADIKDVADIIEENLLTPSLHDLYKLTILFVPSEQVLKIPGTAAYKPRTMTTYDLYGGWTFRWVGQLQAQDMQVRGQRMQEFMKGMAPLLEPLMQQGYTVDLAQLLKMIWRDVLGERGFDRILVQKPPEPPPPAPVPPGALPAGAAPPGGLPPQVGMAPPALPPGAPEGPIQGGIPMEVLAAMAGGGAGSAGTPENMVRQQSRRRSRLAGGPSQ